MAIIPGVELTVGRDAVVVAAAAPLTALSSAVVGGGLGPARTIVNLHVGSEFEWDAAAPALERFATAGGLARPWVGLFTAAWTERAEVTAESAGGVAALVVVTVGLSHPVAAGHTPAAPAPAGTINTIVVVDAAAEPAALVNLALTVTEVKTAVLAEAGLQSRDGRPASGTSTDAVVVAVTGRGAAVRFGGPVSHAGWLVARATRAAIDAGVRRWLAEHR
jgi:adenosylcobinamide amidohydrolase